MSTPDRSLRRGTRVRLKSVFPKYAEHFSGKGCEAIVQGSYRSMYGGPAAQAKQYAMLILPKSGKPYSSAWYEHDWIEEVIPGKSKENHKLLEKYAE